MTTKTEIAWAAGIIDGEGCIHIHRNRAPKVRKSTSEIRTDSFNVVLKVTMGCKRTVEQLAKIFDQGTVQRHVVRNGKANASYSWICQARQTEKVLNSIRPYAVTKAKEIAIAFEFYRCGIAPLGGAGGTSILTKALIRKRICLYWKMRMTKTRWRFYRKALTRRDRKEITSLGLRI